MYRIVGAAMRRPSAAFASVARAMPSHSVSSPSPTPAVCADVLPRGGGAFHATPIALAQRRRRGMARAREPQPGDWTCQCGEPNYRSRRECVKCQAPAPPLPPGVRPMKFPGEDPNDWTCACGKINFRRSPNCFKCQSPKPYVVEPGKEATFWTCASSTCKSMNRSQRKTCFNCGTLQPGLNI